ncbi:dihydrofolate reductase family protein [Microbacterium invictum]|uniref:Dihydrofolate reductase family protein n=1 Tax=Microbacterium invictum TaxID=515415 RepID=A0ABZ0V7F7_9MICO|nr:dihydrofolate reductase family protein [Microbacterium invictum]WQB69548.1 dihydrofolate reductase family protein [Microbacterium invictum]
MSGSEPKVVVEMSMSLDGFVATPDHSTDEVHAWYEGGDVAVTMPNIELTFHVDAASAPIVRDAFELGANVTGRVTFDDAQAWGGDDPMGIPSFIVTHRIPDEWKDRDSPFVFVTDGVESAIAQAKAAARYGRPVGVAGGDIAMQCLRAGLLDELWIHLVPVLLGEGIRLFDELDGSPVRLRQSRVVEGRQVVHLFYEVAEHLPR